MDLQSNYPLMTKEISAIRCYSTLIFLKKSAKLKQYISKTILHPDFSKVFMFEAQIE